MRTSFALVVASLVAGCEVPPNEAVVPEPDRETFAYDVYPVLLADCGFPACHGSADRFFAIYGPGRTRLSSATLPYDPPTPDELALSYDRARSMLVSERGLRESPLLMKPLAPEAGGAGHEGDDPWGAPIFASKSDPDFETIFFWAVASEASP